MMFSEAAALRSTSAGGAIFTRCIVSGLELGILVFIAGISVPVGEALILTALWLIDLSVHYNSLSLFAVTAMHDTKSAVQTSIADSILVTDTHCLSLEMDFGCHSLRAKHELKRAVRAASEFFPQKAHYFTTCDNI